MIKLFIKLYQFLSILRRRFDVIYTSIYISPIGRIYMNSDGKALTGLWFDGSKDSQKHTFGIDRSDLPIFEQTGMWLDTYFKGEPPAFIPELNISHATLFQQEIYDILMKIPYGQTVTYGSIADEIAIRRGIRKMSARAVGGAVGSNPICIIIPCHRVIGSGMNLTGYSGGIEHKIALLESEGHDISRFKMP